MARIQEAPTERWRSFFAEHDRQLREQRLREWARELDVPGRPIVTAFEHRGSNVEAVGTAVRHVEHAPGRLFFRTEDGTMFLAWGVRIKPVGCRPFLEARFGREGNFTFSVHDLEFNDEAANDAALAGLKLFRTLERRGRRLGPAWTLERIAALLTGYTDATKDRTPSKERFFAWLEARYEDEPKQRPSVHTLDARLADAGLTWLRWRDTVLSSE